MNYKRVFAFFALVVFTVVAFAIDGECRARARHRWYGWNSAYARAYCRGTAGTSNNVSYSSGFGTQTASASVYCGSSGARGYAYASNRRCRAYAYAWARRGYASADRGALLADSGFVAIDTTTLDVDSTGSDAKLTFKGLIRAVPGTDVNLLVELFKDSDTTDNDDTLDTGFDELLFEGTIYLEGGSGDLAVTGFDSSNFNIVSSGDTTTVDFDFTHMVPYTGSYDSLGITFEGSPSDVGLPIPSLTPYGMLVLLVLLILSGIIVIRHRRREAVR